MLSFQLFNEHALHSEIKLIKNVFSKFFVNAFTTDEIENFAMPPLFCGTFINILVILYFTNSKIKFKEKVMTIFVFAIFVIRFYLKKLNILWTMRKYSSVLYL